MMNEGRQNLSDLSLQDRSELFGGLIDVVEDWLSEKGIEPADIPNPERDGDSAAIICGRDYDELADGFSAALGISRDGAEMREKTGPQTNFVGEATKEELAAFRKVSKLYEMEDAAAHCANMADCDRRLEGAYESLTRDDYELMADEFEENYSSDEPEYDMWERIAEGFMENRQEEMEAPEEMEAER